MIREGIRRTARGASATRTAPNARRASIPSVTSHMRRRGRDIIILVVEGDTLIPTTTANITRVPAHERLLEHVLLLLLVLVARGGGGSALISDHGAGLGLLRDLGRLGRALELLHGAALAAAEEAQATDGQGDGGGEVDGHDDSRSVEPGLLVHATDALAVLVAADQALDAHVHGNAGLEAGEFLARGGARGLGGAGLDFLLGLGQADKRRLGPLGAGDGAGFGGFIGAAQHGRSGDLGHHQGDIGLDGGRGDSGARFDDRLGGDGNAQAAGVVVDALLVEGAKAEMMVLVDGGGGAALGGLDDLAGRFLLVAAGIDIALCQGLEEFLVAGRQVGGKRGEVVLEGALVTAGGMGGQLVAAGAQAF